MAFGSVTCFMLLLLFLKARDVQAVDYIRPRVPGVAFELSPDYCTAAIWFENGTSIPIAQIQGTPAYQALMRGSTNSKGARNSTLCRLLSPVLDNVPLALGSHTDYCRSPDVCTLKTMLGALKSAVEFELGTNICFTTLVVVEDPNASYLPLAKEVLYALGLRDVMSISSRMRCHMYANRPNPVPEFDESWLVLAINYSEYWFQTGLFTMEEQGLLTAVEDIEAPAVIDSDNQLGLFENTLNNLFANFPPGIDLPKQIHHLVVYGNAKDQALEVLERLVGGDLVRTAIVSKSVFDCAIHHAYWAHLHMARISFEMKQLKNAAFGCKWRSKLYKRSRDEL